MMQVIRATPFVFAALLPGRKRWLWLCHERPGTCAGCLWRVAVALAEEMDHDQLAAIDRTAEAYQAELGAELLTLEQARELRRLTVLECCPGETWKKGKPWDLVLADEVMPAVEVGACR